MNMNNLSRYLSLFLAFFIGFSTGVGALAGGTAVLLSNVTVRDLERKGVPIPDEAIIGENPEVDLLDLTAIEFLGELKNLYSFGDELTINLLKNRYALKFNDKVDSVLSDDAREMPLRKLLSKDGLAVVLSTVYIGQLEKYECRVNTADGYEVCDPTVEGSYWVTKEGKKVSPIEQEIANWTLSSIIEDGISTDKLLNKFTVGQLLGYEKDAKGDWYDVNNKKVTGVVGAFADSRFDTIGTDINDLQVGELLGYEYDEENEYWVETDEEGNTKKVKGVTAILADSDLNGIGSTINNALLGDLLGYDKDEFGNWVETDDEGNTKKVTGIMSILADGGINDASKTINTAKLGDMFGYELGDDGKWYDPENLDEDGCALPVDGFMNKVSGKDINHVDEIFTSLQIGDIVKEEDRQSGIFAIIPPDTEITNIGGAVNDSIMESPLQFFINEGLISFKTGEGESEKDMGETLDFLSSSDDEKKYIYPTDEDFADSEKYYESVWVATTDSEGIACYTVSKWRTQPLSLSFAYIINLMTKFSSINIPR